MNLYKTRIKYLAYIPLLFLAGLTEQGAQNSHAITTQSDFQEHSYTALL